MIISQDRRKIYLLSGLVILFLVAFLVRLIGIDWGIPGQALMHGMYLPDEVIELISSLIIAEQKFQFNIIRNQPFYYFVTFAYFSIYFLVALLTGRVDSWTDYIEWYSGDITHFLLVGRLLVVLLGAATVIAVFYIARRLFSPLVGAVASLFLLFSLGHIVYSRILRLDSFLPFLVAVSFFFLIRILEERPQRLRYYILAGFFIAATTMTKVTGFAMLVPLLLIPFLDSSSTRWAPIKRPVFWRQYTFGVFVSLATYVALAGPSYIFQVRRATDEVVRGASSIVSAMSNRFSTTETYRNLGGISTFDRSLPFHLTSSLPRHLGWPIYVLAVLGFFLLIFERRRRAAVVLLLVTILAFLLPIGYLQRSSDRDMLPLLPLLVICAAYGFMRVCSFLGDKVGLSDQKIKNSVLIILLLIILIWPVLNVYRHTRLIINDDTRELAADWIEESLPPESAIALEPYGPSIVATELAAWSTDLQQSYQKSGRPMFDIYSLLDGTTSGTDVFKEEKLVPFLRENKIEYVVLSSAYYDRFYSDAMDHHFPEHAQQGIAFHDLIDSQLELVHGIYPNWIDTPGPIIKIYQVPDLFEDGASQQVDGFDPFAGFNRNFTAIGYGNTMVP